MDNLSHLIKRCKASISININEHKDNYQSVEQYLKEIESYDKDSVDEISSHILKNMIKSDTVVEIIAYPDTPIGRYRVLHYDLDKAVQLMLYHIE